MTDGTRPNEDEDAVASPPLPPYAAAPPQAAPPAPLPPYAAPVPPYAVQQSAVQQSAVQQSAMPQSAGTPAGPGGVPFQSYPGAPPTWGPPAGGPAPVGYPPNAYGPNGGYPGGAPWQPRPPAAGGTPVLGILALASSILGFAVSFSPFGGLALSWILFIAAIVLAIIALARRMPRKGLAIAAIIISAVGFVFSLVWAVVMALVGGFDGLLSGPPDQDPELNPEYSSSYPWLSAPELGEEGNTVADPLAPGSTLTLFDESVGEVAWEMTVLPFEDLTEEALVNSDETPVYGAFIGVPIELTNATDETIDLASDYSYLPYSSFLTADGGLADLAYVSYDDTYPSVYDLGTIEPGETVTYYEIFDVGAEAVASGSYVVDLDSGQSVYWGPGTL
ncbi:hypothetical protein ACFXQA_11905 [Microbacterium sp. P07]|uniref:hypothetical protein n=1 Tax=Microbacterium sp. P07 TaxID=3366952 RepID=UPI0037468730